jgi:hypothetical protein
MSLEESINRLITVIESRWPVQGIASLTPDPVAPTRSASRGPKPAPPPKYEDVRLAILALSERKSVDAAVGVLKEFDVTHAKSLKPEQYADFLKAVQAA